MSIEIFHEFQIAKLTTIVSRRIRVHVRVQATIFEKSHAHGRGTRDQKTEKFVAEFVVVC